MGPGGHCVHYWVSAKRLMNVVFINERGTWTRESWTDKGNVADVTARYEGWHPIVRGLIGALSETFIWALHDRAPLPNWTRGRVALLGDACHPMLPMAAQGAAQAIEDGAALASLLKAMPDDVPGALARYEAVRKPRATRLQELSAVNRKRFHLPDGPEQQKRDELMVTNGDRTLAAMKLALRARCGNGDLVRCPARPDRVTPLSFLTPSSAQSPPLSLPSAQPHRRIPVQ